MVEALEREVFGLNRYPRRRVDGHTHTELCPHGSGDRTAQMIEKAIDLHMDKICLTEHAPLPPQFDKDYKGNPTALRTAALAPEQVELYLQLGKELKREYGAQIDISLGFEIDFLPGYESFTQEFCDYYGPQTDENILSVHFMEGYDGGFWCLDYSEEEFAKAFGPWVKEPAELYARYYGLVRKAVEANFGKYTPQRIGHLDLIKKYQKYFDFPQGLDDKSKRIVMDILRTLKAQGRELDYNLAGLRKKNCQEPYPSQYIQGMALAVGVPYVLGSDAHGVQDLENTWKTSSDNL